MVKTCSNASSSRINFLLWKKLKSQFVMEFQSLADICKFWQFRADFAALKWLPACRNPSWNLQTSIILKPHIQMMHGLSHWNDTINIYNHKKFQNFISNHRKEYSFLLEECCGRTYVYLEWEKFAPRIKEAQPFSKNVLIPIYIKI